MPRFVAHTSAHQPAVYLRATTRSSPADVLEPPGEGPTTRSQTHKVGDCCLATFHEVLITARSSSSALPLHAFSLPATSCRIDDEIFEHAMKEFPELSENEYAKVTKLDEEWMKSESGKTRWRDFIQS